jgi:hypothetical protein
MTAKDAVVARVVKALKRKLIWIKLAVTLTLLIFVLSKVEVRASLAALRQAQILPLLLGFGVIALQYPVKAVRWKLLLNTMGIQAPITQLLSYILVGRFFNLFMPGTTGGDLVRIYDIANTRTKGKVTAGMTVIADRAFGVLGIIAMGGVGLLFERNGILDPPSRLILIGVMIGMLVTLVILTVLARLTRRRDVCLSSFLPEALSKPIRRWRIEERLTSALQSAAVMMQDHTTTLKVLLLSCLSQATSVYFLFLTLQSLGVLVHPLALMPVLTIIMVVLLLPISIQGIGVREGLYIHFLGQRGIPADVVLSALTVTYGVMIVPGIIGGIIFAVRRRSEKAGSPS